MTDSYSTMTAARGSVLPEGGREESEAGMINLSRRKVIIAWVALGSGLGCACLIMPTQGMIYSLQFSICFLLLILVGFRWWTRPVHSGVFSYFSPHTVILLNGLLFYGIGSVPPLIFPEQVGLNYGATEYYIPMLAVIVAGLALFDSAYRLVVKMFSLNEYIERGLDNFFTPSIQKAIPFYTIIAYAACLLLFLHMSSVYIFRPFRFEGAVSETDNIFALSSFLLLSLTCCLMSILFFRSKNGTIRVLVIIGFVFLLPIFFAFQSRKLVFFIFLVMIVVYALYSPQKLKWVWLITGFILMLLAFLIMSMVKMAQIRDPSISRFSTEEKNILIRTEKIIASEQFTSLENLQFILLLNAKKRVAGLDFPAAIMDAHINGGIPFMHGGHNLLGAAKIIPRVIWPDKPIAAPEGEILRHFELSYRDQLSTLLTSAYADWGIAGVLAGGVFLAVFLGTVLRVILIRKDGILVYLLSLYVLFSKFPSFLLHSPLYWLRWVCIIIVFNTIVYSIYRLVISGKSGGEAVC
ncbi:MAG: O-antigen polymerase [PVC group bacterium]